MAPELFQHTRLLLGTQLGTRPSARCGKEDALLCLQVGWANLPEAAGDCLDSTRRQGNHARSAFSASSVNHLNSGLTNQETSSKCFHLSHCFLLNFIRADNLYIHLQCNVI